MIIIINIVIYYPSTPPTLFEVSCRDNLHGRLGLMALNNLSEHAYGGSGKLSAELAFGLQMMMRRLAAGVPRIVSAKTLRQWNVYSDADYEPELMSGGIGAAIFDDACVCAG